MTGWLALETRGLRQDSAESIKTASANVTIARQQFEASVQPIVELNVEPGPDLMTAGDGIGTKYARGVILQFNNVGTGPLKIVQVFITLYKTGGFDEPNQLLYEVELGQYRNRVIVADKQLREDVIVDVRAPEDQRARLGLHFICADMSGLTKHSYRWNPYDRSLQHENVTSG